MNTLVSFGATPVYPTLPSVSAVESSEDNNLQPEGVRIAGWTIMTRNSSIGNESAMDELTLSLEEIANNGGGAGEGLRKRRLCPPEITFLDAIVSCRYYPQDADKCCSNDDAVAGNSDLQLTAKDALSEWAEAHRYLAMSASDYPSISSEDQHRGVSISRTADADVWSNKSRSDNVANNKVDADEGTTISTIAASCNKSEFYYDWTFSSPYAGTIICLDHDNRNNAIMTRTESVKNNRNMWHPLHRSHIPFHMLQDNTLPILLYDDVHLYEDDLHDNGDVSMTVKIRVMPTCWYILQRLFVRVDRVCVKCREVRYFCAFNNAIIDHAFVDNVVHDEDNNNIVRANVIYRDISWKEATWDELSMTGMPTDPAAWREENSNNIAAVRGGSSGLTTSPPLATLLTQLPSISLPMDIPRFSYFDTS
jgi:type 2A phosphatase activator TIP41